MKLFRTLLLTLALSLGFAPIAFAHTHVRTTSIADNATVSPAPDAFTVAFTDPAAIANVHLTKEGAEIPLAFAPPQTMAASYRIPLPSLAAGAYEITWRMIARDGHVMNGVVHFRVE